MIYTLLCLIWGSTWMAIKIGLADAPPLYASGFRFIIAAAVLWLIILIRKAPLPNSLKSFVKRGVPGLLLYGLSYALLYFAQQYISSALASVLFATYPLFVSVLTLWLLRSEKLSLWIWLGLILGLVGVIVISSSYFGVYESLFWGSVTGAVAALVSALGTVLHKRWFAKDDIVVSAGIQMTFGFIPVIVAAMIFEDISSFVITPQSIGSLIYLSLLGSVVTFLGYYWLLARMHIVMVSSIGYITPAIAIFIGVIGFGEGFGISEIVGTALIMSGVIMVAKGRV